MKNLITTMLFFVIASFAIAQGSLDSGLVAFFPFNGNANDLSGNGHDGTVNGNATLVPDRFNTQNSAYTFPDQTSNISLANTININLETGFTLNSWVKYKNTYSVIIGKHVCGYVNGLVLGIDYDGQFQLWLGNSGWQTVRTSETLVEDRWYMLTATYDGNNGAAKIYIDGQLENSANISYTNFSPYPFSIGEVFQNNCNAANMSGAIDEVKIYNRALSDAEILEEYNNTYTDLFLFLPFNGNANDESGNGNNGTVSGSSLTQDRFGVDGNAYNFDGIDDHITIADNPNLFSDEMTISWWYKMTEILGGERVVIGWVDGGHRYQQFFSGGQLSYLNGYNVAQPGTYFNPIYGLNDLNVWKNVVVTYQKTGASTSTTSIYVDGELKQTDNHFLAMDYVPGIDLSIGKNHNGAFFKGYLDDLRIFNRNLSASEILALYQDSTTYLPELIDSVYPHQNSNYFQQNEIIKVFFSQPMDSASIVSANTTWRRVYVHGSLTGKYLFNVSYSSATYTLEIIPETTLKPGELITVSLDSLILTASGNNLNPYVFQFNVKPENGSVKFAEADSFQLNFSPTNITSGDFNNDGKVDVIVSNYDSSKYTILLNSGSGGFTLGEELAGPFKPYLISFTDIDNDRDLDMIVSTNEQNQIRVLRGTGQGIFSWILPYIDINAPIATCPGDFDGDGDNDFVALCNTGNAIFYQNDGTGVFTPSGSTAINVPATIRNVTGDIDNDGDLDIIAGHSDYNGQFKILRNDGNGVFTSEPGMNLGAYPDEFAGGNFDGDYDIDFVHCGWYGNGISLILNDGQGNYNDYLNLGNVGGQTRNPVVNDFDGDGDQDFVGVFNSNNVGIVKNNTHPNYELSLSYPIQGLKGITAADFDNNGSVDLVGISSTTNQIKFLKNCVDSLVAYYPFSNDTKDYSGNVNDGINYNGIFSKDRYGNDNTSMFFNAVDSYVEGINPGNNLPIGNSPRSFSAWIKNYQYNQWGSNIFHYGTQQAAPTNFHFLITDVLGLGNGYGYGVVYGNTNLIDSTWHFVTGVYEGGTERITKLYVDGKIEVSGAITTEPNTVLTNNWRMGRFMEGSSNFNGNIDELKVYDIPLTNQQVWNMYKTTTTAPNLIYPQDDSTLINPTMIGLVLDWDSTVTATGYRFLLANDSLFNTVIHDTIVNASSFNFYDWFSVNIDNLYWKVRTINDGGTGPWSETNRFNIVLTDVEEQQQLPTEFALLQNYPNPFNPSTIISYELPKTSNVEIKVYDIIGNEITTLVDEEKPAGVYNVEFRIEGLSSGVYLYKLTAGGFVQTKKMILIR